MGPEGMGGVWRSGATGVPVRTTWRSGSGAAAPGVQGVFATVRARLVWQHPGWPAELSERWFCYHTVAVGGPGPQLASFIKREVVKCDITLQY